MNHTLCMVIACNFILVINPAIATAYCHEILQDKNIMQINWSYLQQCVAIANGEGITKDIGENIWRLTKIAFDSIHNIPNEAYKYLGYTLTFIPNEDLRNISMENVDVVKAFGSIRSTFYNEQTQSGFTAEQLEIIAQKVREEWLGKNPLTYSEYDLISMGEIICYLNVSDIESIHADAFREAAQWIGLIEKCPQDRLQALANLAKRPEAFGEPQKWTKLEVSIIGNIVNGLSAAEIQAISKNKLQLNHFYKAANRTRNEFPNSHNTTQFVEMNKNKTDN